MKWKASLILVAVTLLLNLCNAFLNIEELSNAKYSLDILNRPIDELDIVPTEGLKLGSRHGQSYFCKLPEETISTTEKEEEKIPKSTPISSLLEPMKHEECLKIVKGWWTYEFCYGKFVKQYHEEGSEKKGDTTYLGYYESDFDWSKEKVDETYNYKRHKFNRYHSQSYVNGTACDVISHKRDTEIRYLCEDSSTETYIERVDEPSTCSYIMTVRTPHICAHPHTKPQRTPRPIDIICRPVLSTEDYAKFEENEKALKARNDAFFRYAAAGKKLQRRRELFQAEKEAFSDQLKGQENGLKGTGSIEELFFSKFMKLFDPNNVLEDQEQRKEEKVENVPVSEKQSDEAVTDEDAIKMIERFIVGDRLQNLQPMQQRRIVQDVKDLMTMKRHLPTADQARVIQEYVSEYVGTVEDFVQAEEEALEFQEKTIDELNSRLMDDITSIPLPESDHEDEDVEEKKKESTPQRLSVNVKVHQLKKGQDIDNIKAEDLITSEEDAKDYDPSWKKLEDDIGQGLEDAGFQTEGGHIEIRLITNSESLGESLTFTSEEGERFRQMLMELVGGGEARKTAVKKEKSLHDNYNLVWEKGSSQFRSISNFEDENEQDSEVKSPKFQL